MYRRLLLIVLLGVLTTACAPYYAGPGYYRSEVYSVDRYDYRGYDRAYPYNRGYYVVPQQPRYYAPAPRYYRPVPVPQYRPYPGPGYHGARPAPGRYYHDSRYRQGPGQQPQWRHDRDNDHGRERGHGRHDNGWGDRRSRR
ncbi:hypothetical protein G3435_01100 [Pseudomonas sp. MAFF212428]|uniref:Lipoprotein n=1 Tax=Pseudomonas brassicae TaxID=2708063 RepID=A0A6B3NUL6_9PSED|nr:hypothetical protein [Pseudomonas brassicae]NER58956.1 hypothetical protein [Pseudomonas brassicae]NER63044.1 hypothetical protein [Pseudomonas brassicae]